MLTPEVALANDLNLVLLDLVQEPLIKHLRVDCLLFVSLAFRCRGNLDVVDWVDLHILRQPVLVVEHLEGDVARARVWVAVLQGCVRDELRNVLLELAQVLRDVALRETRVLIVGLLLGDARIEVGLLEVKDEVLTQQLHLLELLLLIIDLGGQRDDPFPQRLVVFLHVNALGCELIVVKSAHLLMVLNLAIVQPVGLF